MDTALPASSVLRVLKESAVLPDGWHINREAKVSTCRAGAIFAIYLAAAAAEVCRDGKRSTLSAADVLRALEDVDLAEFVEPLQRDLQAFKDGQASKKKRARPAAAFEEIVDGGDAVVVGSDDADAVDVEGGGGGGGALFDDAAAGGAGEKEDDGGGMSEGGGGKGESGGDDRGSGNAA